jgi:hypothetical protein
VIHTDRRNGAKSSRIVPDTVGGVLASWLPDDLEGSDMVRAAVAKRLAAKLDAPELPAHAVARIAGTLISVVSALDGKEEVAPGRSPSRREWSRVLNLVNSKEVTS